VSSTTEGGARGAEVADRPSTETSADGDTPSAPQSLEGRTDLFVNRELSALDFNDRVLQLAEDESLLLLERVKFLAIFSQNLDEFFMVRVAGLHNQVDAGIDARGPDGLAAPGEVIDAVAHKAQALLNRQADEFERRIRPALGEAGIEIVACEDCLDADLDELDSHFHERILPVLTPLAVGPGRPFPYISNLALSLAVWLRDPDTKAEVFARVKVPSEVLPRFLTIGERKLIPLESAIARHLDALFPGMEILGHETFRVVRDADFTVSDDADDLLRAVEDELRRRRFGEVVRLEVSANADPELRRRLVDWLNLEERQVYDVDGLLDHGDLWEVYGIEGHAELRDRPWSPVAARPFAAADDQKPDLFARMRERDLLVHHPYDSFSASVERLVEQVVEDPDVLAVKLTVYRTSDDSALVPSLIDAAESGKQAVCLVELKARFEEDRNIAWARSLEEAGAHVVHGLPGLKTHAKALVVVRREGAGVRRYVHIGTGNYHAKTSRIYEDLGMFTADPEIAADVAELFNSLTGYGRPRHYRKIVVAPGQLRDWVLDRIERAIEAQREHGDARIVMKMNSLVDPECIRAIYRASQAGVPVDLNVRGTCCLLPGLEGISETVRVVSVVGRFLEHSRIYAFHGGGESEYWIGSADLMPRNLDNRVELLAPVRSSDLRAELEDTLERCLGDDTFAWELEADGTWRRREGGSRGVHAELMKRAMQRAAPADGAALATETPAGMP